MYMNHDFLNKNRAATAVTWQVYVNHICIVTFFLIEQQCVAGLYRAVTSAPCTAVRLLLSVLNCVTTEPCLVYGCACMYVCTFMLLRLHLALQ